MKSASQHQQVRVCKALLSLMGYSRLWTSEGPIPDAKKYLDQYGGPMSNTQWILYQVVWYVWSRSSDVKVQDVLQLPPPYAELVTSLLHGMTSGPAAVEAWLVRLEGMLEGSPTRRSTFRRLG